jgi:hypothetical protein
VKILERSDQAEMGQRARARVENSWSVRFLGERHLEIYEQVMSKRRRVE